MSSSSEGATATRDDGQLREIAELALGCSRLDLAREILAAGAERERTAKWQMVDALVAGGVHAVGGDLEELRATIDDLAAVAQTEEGKEALETWNTDELRLVADRLPDAAPRRAWTTALDLFAGRVSLEEVRAVARGSDAGGGDPVDPESGS